MAAWPSRQSLEGLLACGDAALEHTKWERAARAARAKRRALEGGSPLPRLSYGLKTFWQ
jgi:hypothetical protein